MDYLLWRMILVEINNIPWGQRLTNHIIDYLSSKEIKIQSTTKIQSNVIVITPRAIVVGLSHQLLTKSTSYNLFIIGHYVERWANNAIKHYTNTRKHPQLRLYQSFALNSGRRERKCVLERGYWTHPTRLTPLKSHPSYGLVRKACIGLYFATGIQLRFTAKIAL